MHDYGILGEDDSDVETLAVIVRRLAQRNASIKGKGFDGCGGMLAKGSRILATWKDLGVRRFVVAYDSDGPDPTAHKRIIMERIVKPAGFVNDCCAVIPVQEMEAWILADIQAVSNVIRSWKPNPFTQDPESISGPKEHLERLSRTQNKRSLYSHAIHNSKIAAHLDLKVVQQRCRSFRPLCQWVQESEAGFN